MDPVDVSQGQNRINIVTAKISKKNVQIGEAHMQLQEIQSVCPTGFYQTIKRKVVTMKNGIQWNGVTHD